MDEAIKIKWKHIGDLSGRYGIGGKLGISVRGYYYTLRSLGGNIKKYFDK
jgi:hypothetical protein